MGRRPGVCLLFALCLVAGCRSHTDLLEAELRTRDEDVRGLKGELYQAECQNEALMRELRATRQSTPSAISPELASQTYTLKKIQLGRGTGGYDEDSCPGDEALQVVLQPLDCDGHTIKAPGSVHVEALDITPEGIKTPMSSWDLTPDQVRRSWKSGLLSTGYTMVLPWRNWPTSEKLRVVARFALSDGRMFEADKDVTIRLPPRGPHKSDPAAGLPASPPLAAPELPEGVLPPPRKIDPAKSTSSKSWWRGPEQKAATNKTPNGPRPSPARPDKEPADLWHPRPEPSLTDSIQLLRPSALQNDDMP